MLITGGGAGIGLACAHLFARQGAELILSDIDGPSLKRASTSVGGLGLFCDVASEASVAVFAAQVLRTMASVDVVINAAGRSYVRILGTMRITRAFLPAMRRDDGSKHVVNIAPVGGFVPDACPFPYAASNEAFARLSDAIAENVRGTNIAVTTIIPRLTRSGPHGRRPPRAEANGVSPIATYRSERVDPAAVAIEIAAAIGWSGARPAPPAIADDLGPVIGISPYLRKFGC